MNGKGEAAAMAADWSALPSGPLELISSRLSSTIDYVRFRSVCPSWRSSAPKRPQSPWLVGHRLDGEGNRAYKLFALSDDHRMLPLEELPEFSHLGKRLCRGSSHGWLALELGPDLSLWNPVTGARIQLPPYLPYEMCRCCRKYSFKNVPALSYGDEKSSWFVSKLILSGDSASDCTVLAVCGCNQKIVFCRPGDDSWTPIKSPRFQGWNTDAVSFKGRLYVSAYEKICICNFGQEPKAVTVLSKEDPPLSNLMKRPAIDSSYLVESAGDLLYVTIFFGCQSLNEANSKGTWKLFGRDSEDDLEYRLQCIYECEVFKLEWEGEEKGRLIKMESLGDRSLFLGRNHSFSLPAAQHPGCRPNCIYLEDYHRSIIRVRVCSLEDGTNEVIPHYLDWIPCAWFRPSTMA